MMLKRISSFHLAIVPAAMISVAPAASAQDGPLNGDDFATEVGAIVVTGERVIGGDLFETVPVPETSCLKSAPALGTSDPGFAIDASRFKKIKDLERVRKKTPAGTIFVTGGSFSGAELKKAKLHDMCFFGTDFSQTDWREFSGSGLGFIDSDLTGANMEGARLPYVLFRNPKLAEARAPGADWRYGRLDGGWGGSVRNLDLTGADLSGFRIECGQAAEDGCPTDRAGMIFKGASLRRAGLYAFPAPDADFTDAVVDQTEMALDHLEQLGTARLLGPVIVRSPRRALMLFPAEVKELAADANSSGAAGPCVSPTTAADIAVCAIPGSATRAMLAELNQLEARASNQRNYGAGRADWLAERDNCMGQSDDARNNCLLTSYQARRDALRQNAGSPEWVGQPGYRLFLSSEAAFTPGDAPPALYRRLLPVLLDTATSVVMVKVESRGAIAAKGYSEGPCSFSAENLRYNAQSATIAFPAQRRRRNAPASGGEELLRLGGGDAEVVGAGLARAGQCSADGSFARMRAVHLEPEALAEVWDRL